MKRVIRMLCLLCAICIPVTGSCLAAVGGEWIYIDESTGISIFLPEGFTAVELSEDSRQAGYTGKYTLGDNYIATGVWNMGENYSYADELEYEISQYGVESVSEDMICTIPVLICEDAARDALLFTCPYDGKVYFVFGSSASDDTFRRILHTSVRTLCRWVDSDAVTDVAAESAEGTTEEVVGGGESDDDTVLGNGAYELTVFVIAGDSTSNYTVRSNEKTLMDALLDVGLIDGEYVSWGYNVTTVAGITADYENDGTYWEIYQWQEDGSFQSLATGIQYLDYTTIDIPVFCFEYCG